MDAGHAHTISSRALPFNGCPCGRTRTTHAVIAGRWCARRLVAHALAFATVVASTPAAAQPGAGAPNASEATQGGNDVDRFMKQVFDNRDTSWQRLGDFILREILTLEFEAPLELPLSERGWEYAWYIRDGVAVRRPVQVDGVEIDEGTRREYEDAWLREEARRRAGSDGEDIEPRFLVDTYYFAEFPFEPGSYYFAGRETVADREVFRIEYYPTAQVDQGFDARMNHGFNKTSLVTYWVDPAVHQIVKYTFDNPGLDFLPFRWLLRVDGLESSADMAPIGGVWLPARVTTTGRVTTALGGFDVTVTREFVDYREAETGARLIAGGRPR